MIELKDFISKALIEIIEGIEIAQKEISDGGGEINPYNMYGMTEEFAHIEATKINEFFAHNIKFDISILTSELSGKKSGFGIFVSSVSLGGQLSSDQVKNLTSRISFSVPVKYPHYPKENPAPERNRIFLD